MALLDAWWRSRRYRVVAGPLYPFDVRWWAGAVLSVFAGPLGHVHVALRRAPSLTRDAPAKTDSTAPAVERIGIAGDRAHRHSRRAGRYRPLRDRCEYIRVRCVRG